MNYIPNEIDCYFNLDDSQVCPNLHIYSEGNGMQGENFDEISTENILEVNTHESVKQKAKKENKDEKKDEKQSDQPKQQKKKTKTITKRQKISKMNKHKPVIASEYRKNICGYVTKKAMKEFSGSTFVNQVTLICKQQNADYQETINFYNAKIEGVTGPSHLENILSPTAEKEVPMMRTFLRFFKWFLKEQYIRNILNEGKMQNKNAYIEYKNSEMLPLIGAFERKLFPELNQQAMP